MKKTLEKVAMLSLSLILVSTYSITCVVPKMIEAFPGYSRESVELLVSVTSFGIAFMILLNIWLTRVLSERLSIILGSLIIALSSFSTMFLHSYGVFFLSRVLLGLGIGLINARAITIIQNRYRGEEQASLLGIRGSMEVLGSTFLTFLAGRLMAFGWGASFAVYLLVLPILFLYLLFVTPTEMPKAEEGKGGKVSLADCWPFLLLLFFLGFVFIDTNVSATMRMASLMLEKGLGDEKDASVLLTFMLISGVVAGVLFSLMLRFFRRFTMSFGILSMGLGLILIGLSRNVVMLYVGGALAGFANGMLATTLFQLIPVRLPQGAVDAATYVTLLGCNLGGAFSPYVLRVLDAFDDRMFFSYMAYGVANLVLCVVMLFLKGEKKTINT